MNKGCDMDTNDVNTDKTKTDASVANTDETKTYTSVANTDETKTYASVVNTNKTKGVSSVFFNITISKDKMSVSLNLKPIEKKDIDIYSLIKTGLISKKVMFGVKDAIIKAVIDKVCTENIELENIIIAEGEPATNGEDGKVDYLFKVNDQHLPHKNSGGNLDYHDLNAVQSVTKDQGLARLINPTGGKSGKDVLGDIVYPVAGKESKLPSTNENARISETDKNLIVSNLDGNVQFDGRKIVVNQGFTVKNDVDFSIGNINCKGLIEINGNVKSGFKVYGGADIEIGGYVEDAIIKASGNIQIRGGFVGSGNGIVEALGDISLGFTRNQTIIGANIEIHREALDCDIYAKERVTAEGGKISVAGGLVTAGSIIEANVLGTKTELTTKVEVGFDFTTKRVLLKAKKELNSLTIKLDSVIEDIAKIEEMKKLKHEIDPKYVNALAEFNEQKRKIEDKIIEIQGKLRTFSKDINPNYDAKIVVNGSIHPGVKIKICDVELSIVEELHKSLFYLSKGEIKRS